jgi:uncharacterized protein (DUF924 family)
MQPAQVVNVWTQAGPGRWFKKDPAFDAQIRAQFEPLHHAAARRELDAWAEGAEGALALMLLLDQVPRNLFRGSPHAFATDPLARHFARRALEAGWDKAVDPQLRQFFYLPFEHSESMADQDLACALCAASGDANMIKWALLHRDIIARFGRFPHRNTSLGRETTENEAQFLQSGGFAG